MRQHADRPAFRAATTGSDLNRYTIQVLSQEAPPGRLPEEGTLASSGSRRALAGFFVSGLLISFLGAILPSWQHHLSSEYATVGYYFVGLIAGILASVWISPPLLEKKGLGWTLAFACAAASSALLYLAFVSPPFSPWWRVAGMALVGCAAGILHTAIFYAISPMYRHDPVATVNLGGMLFGLGCLTVALLVSGTFYIYSAPTIQVWIAIIPALFGWLYVRSRFTAQPFAHAPSPHAVLAELRSPGAVLFSLLLFFQFGNEWAVAGWLPLFLSQRLGISPATSLGMLALYWLALIVGRIMAQWMMPRVKHARLLILSVLGAMFGCIVLIETDNRFGAIAGVLLLGGSFAPIYPLVVERIGNRFPSYHPGFYNGLFSFAIAGGMLAPCTLGYFASLWGIWVVMGLTLVGSVMVFLLLMLVWLEARFNTAAQIPPA
jgi:MFS transporter, FHS family, glucose/mannose:H+ symporter